MNLKKSLLILVVCSLFTYQTLAQGTPPSNCDNNYYVNNGACVACGLGGSSTGADATTCTCSGAPYGSPFPSTGTTRRCPCAAGYTRSTLAATQGQCVTCPDGQTSTAGDAPTCAAATPPNCLTNYYADGTTCKTCGPGGASGGANAATCTCSGTPYGATFPTTGTTRRCPCAAGYTRSTVAATLGQCVACPNLQTSTAGDAPTCIATPPNCLANFYADGTTCVACGPGGASTGADAATCTCSGTGYGTTFPTSGTTRRCPCAAGYTRSTADGTAGQCVTCPEGQTSTAGDAPTCASSSSDAKVLSSTACILLVGILGMTL